MASLTNTVLGKPLPAPLLIGAGNERRLPASIAITAGAIAIVTALTVFMIFRFVGEARDHDLQAWQVRLGIVADSRAAAIDAWLGQQHATLRGLADNGSLKLYLTRLALGPKKAGLPDTAEAQYLGNLLAVIAARTGFIATATGPRVRANVRRVGVAGIALLDRSGRPMVTTRGFPPIEPSLRVALDRLPQGRKALIGPYRAPSGRVSIAFVEPIFAVQGSQQIGFVLGIKPVDSELYALLVQPGASAGTQEALLVRAAGPVIEYLSPLADGAKALERKLARNTPKLGAAFALDNPGSFAIRRDYRGREVLVTSRRLKNASWLVVQKIDRGEALAGSDRRALRLLVMLLLAVALVSAAVFGLWRHGASRRASAAAVRFREMAVRFEQQSNFLGLLTDSQPNAIFIADKDQRLRFANLEAARRAGMQRELMIGKPMEDVLGPHRAKLLGRLNRQALEEDHGIEDTHRITLDGKDRVFQTRHVPMAETHDMPHGVLVVEEDVTDAVTEREGRLRNLRDLVGTLMAVVDRRDPNAADHSLRVAFLAHAMSTEIGLSEKEAEAAEFAGRLMNLGKILVPSNLLTKKGKLTPREIKRVRDGIQATADLLENVKFEGPVVETLRQSQEHWDGTGGPKKIKGEGISTTARIIAVANSFVALTSPRAHRDGLGIDEAVDTLFAGVGKEFDRKIVAALVNFLDNHGGRAKWKRLDTEMSE
ncbi:MAG: HD domain-containing phosphohydrolase [Alphaproteobacteria bacterium]